MTPTLLMLFLIGTVVWSGIFVTVEHVRRGSRDWPALAPLAPVVVFGLFVGAMIVFGAAWQT